MVNSKRIIREILDADKHTLDELRQEEKILDDAICVGGNKLNVKHKELYGIIGLMCPNCYKIHWVFVNMKTDITVYNNNSSFYGIRCDKIFRGVCGACNLSVDFITLDKNIAFYISELSLKGYYPQSSCEGHKDKGLSPYISFENKDILNYIDMLPDTWYLDYDYLKKYDVAIIRSDIFQKNEAIRDLSDFCRSIPMEISKVTTGHYDKYIHNVGMHKIEFAND